MNWTLLATVIAGALSGGGFGVVVTALSRRGVVRAEAADVLTDSALELLTAAKADASEARAEAAGARREAAEARVEAAETRRQMTRTKDQMTMIKDEAEELAKYLGQILKDLHDPYASLDRLRATYPITPGANGTSLDLRRHRR